MPQATPALVTTPAARAAGNPATDDRAVQDYPVREYICAMATELARMARWDGDEALGEALDVVAGLAAGSPR